MRLPAPVQWRPFLADAVLEVLRQAVGCARSPCSAITIKMHRGQVMRTRRTTSCVNLVQMADTCLLPITRYALTYTNV
jgi:hypothetical protein